MRVPKLSLTPKRIRTSGPKTAEFGIFDQLLACLAIWSHALPKNANKVPRWVFRYMGSKTVASSHKIRIFSQKTAKFGPKYAFLVILGQILPYLINLILCQTKNHAKKVPRWFFRCVGPILLLSPVKIKTSRFGSKFFLAKYWPI